MEEHMAQSVNKVFLIGRLGKDPEARSEGKIATFSLAMSENWNDKEGQRKQNTTWMNVVVFNQALAEITTRYLKKGSLVAVEGSIANREYTDREGVKKQVTEIVIRQFNGGNITMLDNKPDTAPQQDDASRPAAPQRSGAAPEPR
jgi:single-strand DNA-binding protein